MKLNSPKVREKLQEQDRSIAWLARKTGLNRFTLWRQIKDGSANNADKIAAALGVKPATLIIWEG